MMKMRWSQPGEKIDALMAQRQAIYAGELGWVSDMAWDRYDDHSTTLLVELDGKLLASGRLTVESDGPSELSCLVDWRSQIPEELRAARSAEWSRVMVAPELRSQGLFRRMCEAALARARERDVILLGGASVAELRPLYQRLGFHYLELPFRCHFFEESPIYYPAYQKIQ